MVELDVCGTTAEERRGGEILGGKGNEVKVWKICTKEGRCKVEGVTRKVQDRCEETSFKQRETLCHQVGQDTILSAGTRLLG